jgi:hypothetical protein
MIVRCMLALCSIAVLQLFVMESAVAEEPSSGLNLPSQGRQQSVLPKRVASAPTVSSLENSVEAKPASVAPKPRAVSSAKGPYYVDFRARTAATYGHAFVWYGKTSERKVEVAGLAPAGDVLPYVLGHLAWVPSETGATYGDLDVQYLTASYRVYLSEQDAKRVFAYIKKLQANSPLWNAELNNCTAFLGSIAGFMGLKTPFHLQLPEEYVNSLKRLNGGRQTVQLAAQ